MKFEPTGLVKIACSDRARGAIERRRGRRGRRGTATASAHTRGQARRSPLEPAGLPC